MTFTKTKLVLGIATAIFTLTGAMVSPQAVAHTKRVNGKIVKHTHKKVKTSKVKTSKAKSRVTYEAPYSAPVAAASYDDSALKQRIAQLETRPVPVAPERTKDNMVFFRGGWAHANRERNGVSINSTAIGGPAVTGLRNNGLADKDAWYFGAGLDFSIDDNLFGLMNNTEVLAEIMFEYKEFADKVNGNALATGLTPVFTNGVFPTPAGSSTVGVRNITGSRDVTVSQFTLNASPKIKFLKGNDFRPWVIPVGFAMNIVSPPSESITVLQPALMFGVGADYRVWKNVFVGADARYQQNIGRTLDGVPTNGFSLGGYLGLGF